MVSQNVSMQHCATWWNHWQSRNRKSEMNSFFTSCSCTKGSEPIHTFQTHLCEICVRAMHFLFSQSSGHPYRGIWPLFIVLRSHELSVGWGPRFSEIMFVRPNTWSALWLKVHGCSRGAQDGKVSGKFRFSRLFWYQVCLLLLQNCARKERFIKIHVFRCDF